MSLAKLWKEVCKAPVRSVAVVQTKKGLKLVIKPHPALTRISINLKEEK